MKWIGEIPASDIFAGRQLSSLIAGGHLYKCLVCHLQFRFPRLSHVDFDELYRDGAASHWQYQEVIRQDWALAKNWLRGFAGGKILDVGCWDGNFLSSLPGQWRKSGIEISKLAAATAGNRGVEIVGGNVYERDKRLGNSFDVVTSFDVAEHMEDPRAFLAQLIEYARPGGYVLVGTGNTEVWTWRLAKSRYWYCWPAEHISFVNQAWFEDLREELNFSILAMEEFSHHPQPSFPGLVIESLVNLLYLHAPAVFFKIRRWRWRCLGREERKIVDYPPVWGGSRDHIFAVLQKLPVRAMNDAI